MKNFRFVCLFLVTLFGVLYSCTIVQNSDITSLSQLNSLSIKSIDIIQNLDSLNLTSSATVIDSVVSSLVTIDINNKINGTVTKLTKITWPTVNPKSKLKFRSGVTSGIQVRNYFFQNGLPRSSQVVANNQLKEWFTFYYDNNWQLTNFRSRIYTSTAPDTTVYRDSLIYNSSSSYIGYIGSLVRKAPYTPSQSGTINFPYATYGSDIGLGGGNVTYLGYNYGFGNCLCPNNSGNSCSGCTVSSGNNSNSSFIVKPLQVGALLSQLQIEDVKVHNNSSCQNAGGGGTNYDTYYFHPLMLMRSLFSHGDALLNIYSIDWWQPGPQISSPLNNNETVTFNFNYGQ